MEEITIKENVYHNYELATVSRMGYSVSTDNLGDSQ